MKAKQAGAPRLRKDTQRRKHRLAAREPSGPAAMLSHRDLGARRGNVALTAACAQTSFLPWFPQSQGKPRFLFTGSRGILDSHQARVNPT